MTEQEMTQDIKNYIERLEKENQELSDEVSYLIFSNKQSKIKRSDILELAEENELMYAKLRKTVSENNRLKNKLNCFNFFRKIKTFFSIKTP